MPPKSAAVVGFTIRLKCQKQTVLLILAPSTSISALKSTLATAINESKSGYDADDDLNEDDIIIPKPSFDVASDAEIETTENEKPSGDSDNSKHINVNPSDIKLGIPVDKTNLSKGWSDITKAKGSIESNGISDNSLLAFTTSKEDDFEVELPDDSDRLEEE